MANSVLRCFQWKAGRYWDCFPLQSEKTHEPMKPIYYQLFARMASDGVEWVKTGKSEFLSPVRLPFRHSGNRLLIPRRPCLAAFHTTVRKNHAIPT
jgi:hypothetical protein